MPLPIALEPAEPCMAENGMYLDVHTDTDQSEQELQQAFACVANSKCRER